MSFFDQPYYAFTKTHLSLIGMWPEQSKYVRIIRLLTIFAIVNTVGGGMFLRLYGTWADIRSLMQALPYLLIGAQLFLTMLILNVQHFDKIKLGMKNIEEHWEMFKNTSAVSVLNKYAERGRHIIVVYALYNYTVMTLYLALYLSPTILDVLNPLNETRPKMNMFNAEYGVNVDKYYWFILAFESMVVIIIIGMTMAVEAMYVLCTIHACALFEVVGFNLKLVTHTYTANKENDSTRRNDWNYQQICDCISAHKVAISFADLIESICSGLFAIVLIMIVIMIIFTSVETLINSKHPEMLIQLGTFTCGQVINLYLNSIPGQELMNHSRQIHTIVCVCISLIEKIYQVVLLSHFLLASYDLAWQDMSVKAQKLLIPIMIRSNKPCCLTAGKVYILSMESFGTTIRTVVSYFMLFAQLIQ